MINPKVNGLLADSAAVRPKGLVDVWPQQADFEAYIKLERGLSENTRLAYVADIRRFMQFISANGVQGGAQGADTDTIRLFFDYLVDNEGVGDFTQARNLSSLRALFAYLQAEGLADSDPTDRLDTPKTPRHLPSVLSLQQIDAMLTTCDLDDPLGIRNRAMLELLYAAGLRVSEVVGLPASHLYADQGFVRVIGKGNKERLVPVGRSALQAIDRYWREVRSQQKTQPKSEGLLFLNRRGAGLTRVMAFHIVRNAALAAGIAKPVSPHTLRHSFATHLIEGGADLQAVKEMLGHESIATTEIYLHVDQRFLRSVYEAHHPRA